jgi:hypothetical protein
MAELPAELIEFPAGIGWLYELLPPNATAARVGALVMVLAALCAAVGYRARPAAAVWCILAVWVWGIPNLYGKVDHNHHVLWFAALLAASPCADALALGAGRRTPPVMESVRYGFPIRVWWALIAIVYFFAGLPKLLQDGFAWASPDNLRPLLHTQWAVVEGFQPLFRIDELPLLLWAMGLGTILFEMGFIFLVFTRLRPLAVAAGIAFHLSTYAFLDISFTSLLVCYAAFVPWRGLTSTTQLEGAATASADVVRVPSSPLPATSIVAGGLLTFVVLFGAMNVVDGWPFASYPAFTGRFSDRRAELEFELVLDDGSTQRSSVDEVFGWVPASRRARISGQFLALDEADQRSVLGQVDFTRALGRRAARVRADRVLVSTDPDARVELERERVLDVELPHDG